MINTINGRVDKIHFVVTGGDLKKGPILSLGQPEGETVGTETHEGMGAVE